MKRREFITLVGVTAATWPLTTRAQQAVPRVGALVPYAESDSLGQTWLNDFVQAMQAAGWTDGRNIQIDVRWAGGTVDRIQRATKELVDLQPQVILAVTTPSVNAVRGEQ